MKETLMWKRLNKYFEDKPIFLQRIESREITLGVLDIYFSSKKMNGWIELKEIKKWAMNLPLEQTYKVHINIPFRPGQKGWISTHLKYNNNIFIIYTTKDNLWGIIPGKMAILNDLTWNDITPPKTFNELYLELFYYI